MVLLDFDRGQYFGLNAVGATIWRVLSEGSAEALAPDQVVQHIAAVVVSEYEVDLNVAVQDTKALMEKLLAEGLVQARL